MLAAVLFTGLLLAASTFLWNAHRLTLGEELGVAFAIVAGLCIVGALCTPAPRRPSPPAASSASA